MGEHIFHGQKDMEFLKFLSMTNEGLCGLERAAMTKAKHHIKDTHCAAPISIQNFYTVVAINQRCSNYLADA